ncbi:serine protease [Prosthecobacter sp.]|uniref:serine protease n=1 Tax=Prosthecobacter sp. TaxID=1965333 RepID=UPI00378316CD
MKKSVPLLPLATKAALLAAGILLGTGILTSKAQEVTPLLEVQSSFGKKSYQNAKVMAVTPQGVKILHDGGISVIPTTSLPREWLTKYAPEAAGVPSVTPSSTTAPAMPKADAVTSPQGAVVTSFDPASLVIIKTDNGSGSGFIAKAGGKTYIYTNAHVICGSLGSFTSKIVSIQTASGRTIPVPYELELSDVNDPTTESGLEDVARLPIVLKEGESAYEISELDPNIAMSAKVIAYGNSLGGNVVTSLPGTILGLGSDRLEISCEIVPGNSGGPVVLEQTKKVIGISTYATNGQRDIWSRGTKFDGVRRFAMRPEKVTKWRKMLYTSLMSSTAELNAFDRDTLSLAAACFLNPKRNNAGFDFSIQSKGDYVIRTVLVDGAKHSLGQSINAGIARVNQKLGGGMGGNTARMAVQGVVGYFAEFFNTVSQASSSQMQSLQSADRAPYLKKYVPDLLRERKEVHTNFVQQVVRFR